MADRSFQMVLVNIRGFCTENKIGFGADDKDDDDESAYTIAYEVDNNNLFLFLVKDETETEDQIVLKTAKIHIMSSESLDDILRDLCKEILQN